MTVPGQTTAPAGLDVDRLAAYLAAHRPGLLDGPIEASLIPGGRSNLTYQVRSGALEYVLRRPPLGHVLATAHDMAREFRVISALAATAVPVPGALLHCSDPDAIGAPFYLMTRAPGVIFRTRAQTDRLTDEQRQRLAYAMMDTLAALHSVDPAAVGLADFGHPEGYLARQVRRWAGQLDRSRSRPLPGIDELRDRLAATVPASDAASPVGSPVAGRIVHGDYRLDNLLADPETMTITAVLDWEMATLGDPLADLGLLMTYWQVLGDGADNPVADGLGPAAGFPSRPSLIARYAATSPVDIGPLDWHVALGCFKLAVICEGIYYRYTLGQTVGEGFDRMGQMVAPLVEHGLRVIREI
ncbi:MAG TPA: phosphotransferase family protein [Micromonosporaceae bacterium]|jgi:aminoglycoside phosphotransferase (APT) family kinase protein